MLIIVIKRIAIIALSLKETINISKIDIENEKMRVIFTHLLQFVLVFISLDSIASII
jgi:hypothetical protein